MARLILPVMMALMFSAISAAAQSPIGGVISPDCEIEDVRALRQNFAADASFQPFSLLGKTCRDDFLSEFMHNYHAPWRGSGPLSDIPKAVTVMKEHCRKEWYGENRRKVPRKELDLLLADCDLESFPSLARAAVAIVPTAMRVLPTERPFFERHDDFPFDVLQNAGLKVNEPVRVLHLSADGVWAFAETADANGWVRRRDIAYIDERHIAYRMRKAHVVIVRDFASIRDAKGTFALRAKVGTLFPVTAEREDGYEIVVPVPDGSGGVREARAILPKGAAKWFPLTPDGENFALIGNELIDRPYGWGELYQGRDCSSLVRDFLMPFGIWLPRGSYNQINSGRKISLAGLSLEEKERFISENGVPFLTLIHLNGHIMLYAGSLNGRPLIFHALWGVNVRNGEGRRVKHVVGKSIISTLKPGEELKLANGPLLEKVSSMLILGEKCPRVR